MEIRQDATFHDAPVEVTPLAPSDSLSVAVPGSKSYTLRALFLGAMTPGRVIIDNALESDDTAAAIHCLRTLGIIIKKSGSRISIMNDISVIKDTEYDLDVNQSGVTLRFLIALCCLLPGRQTIYGTTSLNERPVKPLIDALLQLGADITYLGKPGNPPILVSSSTLQGSSVSIDGSMSSQYISALLQVAPLLTHGLTLIVEGALASAPYVEMTIDIMQKFGVRVLNDHFSTLSVNHKQNYHIEHYKVEGDISSASYFFAIAALTKSTITVTHVNPDSRQADMAMLNILEKMSAQVEKSKQSITVTGHGVRPVVVDMEQCPDQVMTIAVLAAYADGETTIRGIRTLRVKETDRVMAIESELKKMGIDSKSTQDELTIYGGVPRAANIDTYHDHRIAMALSVAGTITPGIRITNPRVVEKTFPTYWLELAKLARPSDKAHRQAPLDMLQSNHTKELLYGR